MRFSAKNVTGFLPPAVHEYTYPPMAMEMGATAEARAYVESQGEGWRTLLEQAISTSIKERAPDMAGRIGELLLEGPGGAAQGSKKVSFENLHVECDSLQAPPSAARAPSLGRRFTVANMDPKIIAAKCDITRTTCTCTPTHGMHNIPCMDACIP